ncbi:RagB/SusD family nutrient uptake outer membrane protein [uncultured Flavobacterium sp.]|uniref:RagB/SusD family nutrient uptake outer membrane protein n=1 Tax=uncultured Flavobacterium sp. TaxID=165435 RepID=UPI0030CA34AD
MKNIFKSFKNFPKRVLIVLVLVMGSMLSSCNNDIIELEPFTSVSETSAFSTPSLIELSVNGMYNAAAIGLYNGSGRGYPFGAAHVQQGDNRGEDVVNTATFYQLTYTATYSTTTANNVYMWLDTYRLINRSNIIIDGVTKAVANGTITAAVGDDYIGQALYFRAIAHMELLIHFAKPYKFTTGATHEGVPYRALPYTTQDNVDIGTLQGRNSVKDCYDLIVKDLNDAEAKLLPKSSITRASKEAAIAMKTRAFLNMGDWDKVITEGLKLTGFSLTPSPNGPFDNSYSNTESIFSMAMSATNNPGVNAALASQYKRRKLVCMSPIIWRDSEWLVDDKRRTDGELIFKSGSVIYTNKYKDDVNYTDASPIIRYAEVLLNMSEAYARKSTPDLTNALAKLNLVRNRSLASPSTQAYTSGVLSTPTLMVNAILKERRIEFVMEGLRWGDIHRLQHETIGGVSGIPAKLANGTPSAASFTLGTPYSGALGTTAVPYSDYRFLWPIPQVEVDANPTLAAVQNPGY